MEKLELRARARATVRSSRFTADGEVQTNDQGRVAGVLPAPLDIIDETQARAACKPMGELESVVQSASASGRVRAFYVVVPDLAMKPHYERLGLAIEAGCRVLVDAASLVPVAVMRVSACAGDSVPSKCTPAVGFNPYFDMPAS